MTLLQDLLIISSILVRNGNGDGPSRLSLRNLEQWMGEGYAKRSFLENVIIKISDYIAVEKEMTSSTL